MSRVSLFLLALTASMGVGCGDRSSVNIPSTMPAEQEAMSRSATEQEPVDDSVDLVEAAPRVKSQFDVATVPVTEHDLGGFPFFEFPHGYEPMNRPHRRAYARFPYWLGDGVRWVEGTTYSTAITSARGKTFSELELRRNMELLLESVGATRVFEGHIPRDVYYDNPDENEIGGGFIDAVNGYTGDEAKTTVYLIRQAGREVWVQLATTRLGAGYVVTESLPFQPTSAWTEAFPYLTVPEHYEARTENRDFDRFPFWTGEGFEWVEGRTSVSRITHGQSHRYSMHELRRNVETVMERQGATRVFAGLVPEEPLQNIDKQLFNSYSDGAGYSWHKQPMTIYRIDRDGREIWVLVRLEYLSGGWVIAEREGFRQTAGLIGADQLRKQLETDGKVALQVHFATDKADILPESQPQIAQVLLLLRENPELSLAINGHTDNTGGVGHNRMLSEARAQAVVDVLASQGVEAARLQAAGFGQDRPVADNATEEGRAKNRRVELVRL